MEFDRDAHRELGRQTNGEVWDLLGKASRTEDDNRRLVHAAHTSHYHWLHAGDELHEQRGEWLISHVYAVLGHGEASLRHARRCAEITEAHGDRMKDFDVAYSVEALARANAVLGNKEEAASLKNRAKKLGDALADPEDKKIFVGDLDGGDWHGVD